jgi:hypothetical protein
MLFALSRGVFERPRLQQEEMFKMFLPDRRFMQVAWVVPDLDAAVDAWLKSAKVGPFFMFGGVAWEKPVYRGKSGEGQVDLTAAIAYAGDIQIELICQLDDKPSMFRDIIPFGQAGLHHMALYCDDYDADLASYTENGTEVAFSGVMMGSRVCWVDTTPSLGFMVELIDGKNNIAGQKIFPQIRAAAENWDGTNPKRRLS